MTPRSGIFARRVDPGPAARGRLRGAVFLTALGVLVAWPGGAAAGAEDSRAKAGAVAAPFKILAFGDSLTHGYGLAAGQTFPAQLEAALKGRGLDVRVINGGNSGDTTAAGRARLEWALADRPDIVLVELGGNDGLRGIEPAATYGNLDAILARLEAEGVAVLLAGMLAPRNLGADYAAEFDAVFPRLAAQHQVMFYPFFLDGVAMDPALNQPDGIHPNDAGVKVIVEGILPSVLRLIEDLGAGGSGRSGPGG
ncbi:MAG: arylesterase [Kiloniellaceae bacterium]